MPDPGAPVAPRQFTLDALRGFAVIGILAMNIVSFALPDMAYFSPAVGGTGSVADVVSWAVGFVFVDGKMRGIFTLLFGASMLLIADAAAARGDDPARVHARRMGWLFAFGLAHYLFVWSGDILSAYAMVGMLAFPLRHWAPATLWRAALILFGAGLLFWGLVYGVVWAIAMLGSAPDAGPLVTDLARALAADDSFAADGGADAVLRGGYPGILALRLGDLFMPFTSTLLYLHETLACMLIGMAMYRQGWLSDDADLDAWRRRVVRLVPAGLILTALCAAVVVRFDYDPLTALNASLYWVAAPRLMLTIGYVGIAMLAIARWRHHGLMRRIAAAGRMAFSNYLMTSIVMTTIFYGYGLGLYGQVSRAGLWLFVLGGAVAMLAWSAPWLRRFHYGPFEWLWRRLARGGTVPFAR